MLSPTTKKKAAANTIYRGGQSTLKTIEEWPFCEQNNTLLGFTALFTHHNYPPHFEEVGENSFGVGLA